jgi:hypothetical protein
MSQSIKPNSTQQAQSLQQQSTAQEVNLLFCRITAIYGQSWLQNFPTQEVLDLAKIEWIKQLQNFTALDIERALQAIIESGEKYPPNLPVFVKRLNENKEQRRYKTYGAA